MADTTVYQGNSDAFKTIVNFKPYINDLYNRLTGNVLVFKPATKKVLEADGKAWHDEPVMRTLPDGTQQQEWIETNEKNTELEIVNDTGAQYICHHLEAFLNVHTAQGNIHHNAEAAKLAADISLSTMAHVIYNAEKYGCKKNVDSSAYEYYDFSLLENEFDTIMRQLYLYFTSITEAGIRTFGEKTSSSNYSASVQEQPQQQGTLGGGIRQKLGL